MSGAILDAGGTLLAYLGDGILAVFGAPIEADDHADRALSAAREMVHERLPRFNAWLVSEGIGDGFAMGVGIASGPFMSGNVGSERRLEYTAIGDTVNTAARLESLTKEHPHAVLVSDTTRALLSETAGSSSWTRSRRAASRRRCASGPCERRTVVRDLRTVREATKCRAELPDLELQPVAGRDRVVQPAAPARSSSSRACSSTPSAPNVAALDLIVWATRPSSAASPSSIERRRPAT